MNENIATRREIKAARESAIKKARNSKYLKAFTAAALGLTLVSGSAAGAMAATTGPSLGSAVTASQAAAAPYESITRVTGTEDGLNIDVDMSAADTGLLVSTLSDDGAGNYKIQILATGTTAGDWSNLVGDTFDSSFGGDPATVTVTGVNGSTVDLDIHLATAPNITPTFTATGSITGPAPIAPKANPTATDDVVVLDTMKETSVTADVLANDAASTGYAFDPASLILVNPVTGAQTTSQQGNASLNVVDGKIAVTAVAKWSGFTQATYTAKEQWAGAPGTEPAGYTPGTITGVLKVQVIGAQATQPDPADCTVQAAPMGGTGFYVSMAATGGTGLACNLVAAADTVSIAPDATQATVNVAANDQSTNSSYTVDPQSIEFRAPDGTFSNDVLYPGQFAISYDSTTGISTVKRLGTFSGTPQVLYRVSESKLDGSGNKLVGGSSSALLTMDFAPVPTIPAPVVPETPAPVVPETPAPVVPATPVTVTANTPAPETPAAVSRPFADYADTSSDFGANKANKAVSVAPQENDDSGSLAGILIGLGTAGAFTVKARHRKTQKSDVPA